MLIKQTNRNHKTHNTCPPPQHKKAVCCWQNPFAQLWKELWSSVFKLYYLNSKKARFRKKPKTERRQKLRHQQGGCSLQNRKSIQDKHRRWPTAAKSCCLKRFSSVSGWSLEPSRVWWERLNTYRSFRGRSVALYNEGLSVLTGTTDCGRSRSVPLGIDGQKSSLSEL